MQSGNSSVNAVEIAQNGHCLSPDSDQVETLGNLFGLRVRPVDSTESGMALERRWQPLLYDPKLGRMPNAGLVAALRMRAAENGIPIGLIRSPMHQLPEPDRRWQFMNPSVVDFVHQHERGLLACARDTAAWPIIYDLIRAYPQARILCVDSSRASLKKLQQSLRERDLAATYVSGDCPYPLQDHEDVHHPRIILATPRHLARNMDAEHADILLLLRAETCSSKLVDVTLAMVDARFRLFGLVRLDNEYARWDQDAMFATFGPAKVEIHRNHRVRRPAFTFFLPTPRRRANSSRDERFSSADWYWFHQRRNERICRIAKMFTRELRWDARLLGERDEILDALSRELPVSVAIVVDRARHAEVLANMLPDFRVYADDAALRNIDESFRLRVIRDRQGWDIDQKKILVGGEVHRHRGDNTVVLINAAGGNDSSNVPHSMLTCDDFRIHLPPLMIVDFHDRQHRKARRRSRNRVRDYGRRDIFSIGTSAEEERTRQFLSRQPEEETDDVVF